MTTILKSNSTTTPNRQPRPYRAGMAAGRAWVVQPGTGWSDLAGLAEAPDGSDEQAAYVVHAIHAERLGGLLPPIFIQGFAAAAREAHEAVREDVRTILAHDLAEQMEGPTDPVALAGDLAAYLLNGGENIAAELLDDIATLHGRAVADRVIAAVARIHGADAAEKLRVGAEINAGANAKREG